MKQQRAAAAVDFGRVASAASPVFDLRDLEVAQGGDVEHGADVMRPAEAGEVVEQIVVRCEGLVVAGFQGSRIGGADASEAEDFKATSSKLIRQSHPQFTGREIRQPADLVDGLEAGAGGDHDFHAKACSV